MRKISYGIKKINPNLGLLMIPTEETKWWQTLLGGLAGLVVFLGLCVLLASLIACSIVAFNNL